MTVANTTLAAKAITASTTLTVTGAGSIQGLTVGRGAAAGATNTAVGASALAANTSSQYTVALGNEALKANTTGDQNTAVGGYTLVGNTTGSNNTAVGVNCAWNNTTGSSNTAIGHGSLNSNTTASSNTAVGYQAGYSNTVGQQLLAIGYQAGYSCTGDGNTFIGYQAGQFTTATTTGQNNIFIGPYSRGSGATINTEIVMGYNLAGKGTQTFYVGGTNGAYNSANSASWSTTSDRRLKKNIVDNNIGLEKITAIQVRNFEYRLPEEVDAELKPTDAIKKEGVQLGAIAQELQQVLPDCVKTESTGVMSVNTDNLTWYLINAIKELKAEIDALKGV
jgi:hypothetical protein